MNKINLHFIAFAMIRYVLTTFWFFIMSFLFLYFLSYKNINLSFLLGIYTALSFNIIWLPISFFVLPYYNCKKNIHRLYVKDDSWKCYKCNYTKPVEYKFFVVKRIVG